MIQYYFTQSETAEEIALRGFIAIVSIGFFIFWRKRKALINFQAWALLTAVINLILIGNQAIICFYNKAFDTTTIRFIYLLQYLTTLTIMCRLWKLSDKYMPKELEDITDKVHLYMKAVAVWNTFKNGGNRHRDDKKIQNKIINIGKTA